MSADLKIDYYTPEFEIFKKDVLAEGMNGAVVMRLTQFAPPVATDFRHKFVAEGNFPKMDILITVTQVNCPAMIIGNTDAGKRFIKMRKYAVMK